MDKIIKWENTCDNIGDFFRNPILLKIIKNWAKIKDIKKLKIYSNKSVLRSHNNKRFSSEFYEFIRDIFENRSNMDSFLDYLRKILLIDEELMTTLKSQYETDDFVKALLAFDELNDQLSTIKKLSVWDVFSTKIANIIGAANNQPSHFQDEDEVDVDYSLSQLKGLRATINAGVMPIGSDGEILLYIDEDNGKYMMSTLSTWEIIYTDKNWNRLDKNNELITIKVEKVLDSRKKVLEELEAFSLAFDYHLGKIKSENLPENAEKLYENLALDFSENNNITPEALYDSQEYLTKFKKWMIEEYRNLDTIFKKMPASDTKRIDEWKWKNINTNKHKPVWDLPTNDLWQKYPKKKWIRKFTVVKN